jgi:hypothetical protein
MASNGTEFSSAAGAMLPAWCRGYPLLIPAEVDTGRSKWPSVVERGPTLVEQLHVNACHPPMICFLGQRPRETALAPRTGSKDFASTHDMIGR